MPYDAPVTKDMFLGIRLEPEESDALKAAAKDDARPASALARKIIADWLREKGWLAGGPKPGPKPPGGL
jgi:hypothetical protein